MQFLSFRFIINRIRAISAMMKDKNVSFWKKALIVFGVIYLLSPVDLIPAVIFPFGFMDDIILWAWILIKLKDTLDGYWMPEKEGNYSQKYKGKDIVEGVDFSVESTQDEGSGAESEDKSTDKSEDERDSM